MPLQRRGHGARTFPRWAVDAVRQVQGEAPHWGGRVLAAASVYARSSVAQGLAEGRRQDLRAPTAGG